MFYLSFVSKNLFSRTDFIKKVCTFVWILPWIDPGTYTLIHSSLTLDQDTLCVIYQKMLLSTIHIFVRKLDYSEEPVDLRVELLLKTESGYLRGAEVTWFTLANPYHSLRFNTHWSVPPVSALARSGGPRKMSQSPVSRNSNIERRMDRPRAVVGVIRGVA